MLDMMESLVEHLNESGGNDEDSENEKTENVVPCKNCGIVHGSEDEDEKIMEKVRDVLSGKGGMLSIIDTSAKERSDGQAMGVFLSRNMDRDAITNGMLNLMRQVFQRLTKDLPENKKWGYKRMIIGALEDNL